MKSSREKMLLFLIGTFSMTSIKLVGMIGISELIMLIVAPFVFLNKIYVLRKEGVMPILILTLLWFLGACLSDYLIGTPLLIALRGIAFPLVTFATIVCVYVCLRKDPYNLKYLIVGMTVSSILTIFFFKRNIGSGAVSAIEQTISYKLFWASLFTLIFTLPMQINYFKTPLIYAIPASLALSIYDLHIGGRSMFLIALVTSIMFMFVRHNTNKLKFLRKYSLVFLGLLLFVGIFAGSIYKKAVKKGWMGEAELVKYEQQTGGRGEDLLSIVMSGRSDFFVSLIAALDRPILGWGSHALDYNNCQVDFALKYGSDKAIEEALQFRRRVGIPRLPMHSPLTAFWAWHGIFGFLFWAYALYLILVVFIKHIADFPPYFGYLAISVPSFLWIILASPYTQRTGLCTLLAVCLLIKNMKQLPQGAYGGMR